MVGCDREASGKGLPTRRARPVIVTFIVVAQSVIVGSCGSTTLPPRLTASQRRSIAAAPLRHVNVGVERFAYSAYSERLTAALGATRLFARVDALEAFETPPTCVARVERAIYGTAVVPWATVLTLGLVPTKVAEEHGYAFSLTASSAPAQKVPVEFSYTAMSTLGWSSVFLNLSPDATGTDVYGHPRLVDDLAWAIVESCEHMGEYASGCCGTESR
jgi:hypothetical protein